DGGQERGRAGDDRRNRQSAGRRDSRVLDEREHEKQLGDGEEQDDGREPDDGDGDRDERRAAQNAGHSDPGGFAPADPPRLRSRGPMIPAPLRRARPWRAGTIMFTVAGWQAPRQRTRDWRLETGDWPTA